MGHEMKQPDRPVTLAIIGCGQRGHAYAGHALLEPIKCKIVAIAEPRPKTKRRMIDMYHINQSLVFDTWTDFHQASADTIKTVGKRLADVAVITVHDRMRAELVEAFAAQGYHILCEKPMATDIEHCIRMEDVVKKVGIIFGMGHVLRYLPYTQAITKIVRSGELGPLVNAVHVEPAGHWHFTHSYVRGPWAREKDSCFSLMTKSCHDIDILDHWLSPTTPSRISSFGGLQHFKKSEKSAAAGGATRCFDCAAGNGCPYSAKKIYLDNVATGNHGWPATATVDGIPDIENVGEALRNGPYGVYEQDNDVCDNQVVNIQYSSGATASFTMVAFTTLICERQTRLHFTYGEIVSDMKTFTVTDFRTGKQTVHTPKDEGGGHEGGDSGLSRSLIEAVRTGRQDVLGTDVMDVLKSHLTVFAAERSRREGVVVDCEEFERKARQEYSLTAD